MTRRLADMTPAEAAMYLMSGAWESDQETKRERKRKSNPRVEKDHKLIIQAQDAMKKVTETGPTAVSVPSEVNSDLDPEIMQAGIVLAGYYIEGGACKFVEYAKKMIEDLGDSVKPYLKSWYAAVRLHPGFDTKDMDSLADVEAIDIDEAVAEPKKGAVQTSFKILLGFRHGTK